MARIPESEVERLKSDVSLVRLIEGAGHVLKPQGRDLAMRCPLHEGDDTPSFIVTPGKNVWHCFGCQQGGSVIDWVMQSRSVSFRHAVELLRSGSPALAAPATRAVRTAGAAFVVPTEGDAALRDRALLAQVIAAYHATLKDSPDAQSWLAGRGLAHPDLIDTFGLGFANRTLGYRLPEKNRAAGAEVRGALQRIGILRASGHEHFAGSLIMPVLDADGGIAEVYGRKVTPANQLRTGTPLHLYLPGPHRGVFNRAGWQGSEEVILCESLIDALTFWCAGYRNVTAAFGVSGFTDELCDALAANGTQRVLIAFDRDEAGDRAAARLVPRFEEHGIAPYRVLFPKGMDANAYAGKVGPADKSLGLVLRRAEYLGQGLPPTRSGGEVPALAVSTATAVSRDKTQRALPTPSASPMASVGVASTPTASSLVAAVDVESVAPLPEPSSPVPMPAVDVVAEVNEHDVAMVFGGRRYRVRGLARNLAFDVLKVNVMVSNVAGAASSGSGQALHVDTLDLYQAKARAVFVKQAALELGVEEAVIARDLGQVLLQLETLQEAAIKAALLPRALAVAVALPPGQQDAALALLRDPELAMRIVADVASIGVVGEDANALVGYLACVSRKLERPLAILIQSTSAAGKSTLMDALLSLMPESERVQYSAMTGQSLFYLGEGDLRHRILAIAEEEGVRQAAYALKLLQSQGELTIASTGKDPTTGKLVTEEYRVEGPVMLFLTSTAIDLDEELLNRCMVLTINESREQTEAIHRRQRTARTLEGLLTTKHADSIRSLHRAAQQLLRPVAVVNPYAEQLTFRSESTRMRRDHAKYLTLIDAIAYLHQHQRPNRQATVAGQVIEYVEVTLDDIALANRLASEVLGRSLDELPPQTRRVLCLLMTYVAEHATAQALLPKEVRFTRREARTATGLRDTQLRVHLDRLMQLDYLLPHTGRNGQRFVYELAFDGAADQAVPQLVGLLDVEALRGTSTTPTSRGTKPTSRGQSANLAGSLRPACGGVAARLRGEETPRNASTGAAFSPLVAAFEETPLLGTPRTKPSYRNGSAAANPAAPR